MAISERTLKKGSGNLLRDLLTCTLVLDKVKSNKALKLSRTSPDKVEEDQVSVSCDGRSPSCSICGVVNDNCGPFTPQEIGILQEFVLKKGGSNISSSFCVWICPPCSQTLRRIIKLMTEVERIITCLWTVIRIERKEIDRELGGNIGTTASNNFGDVQEDEISNNSPTSVGALELEMTDIESESEVEDELSAEQFPIDLDVEGGQKLGSILLPMSEQIVDEVAARTSPKIWSDNDRRGNIANKESPSEEAGYKGGALIQLEVVDIEANSDSEEPKGLPINLEEEDDDVILTDYKLDSSLSSQNPIEDDLFLVPGSEEVSQRQDVPGTREGEDGEEPMELEEMRPTQSGMEIQQNLSQRRESLPDQQKTEIRVSATDEGSISRYQKVKCDVCELEYGRQSHLTRHFQTFLHKEGVNSRKVGPNGDVTFICSCYLEFNLLAGLVSHKKGCGKILNTSNTSRDYQRKRSKKLAISQLRKNQKSSQMLKCGVCELEYSGEYQLDKHLSTLRHKEGANSRKVGPIGEVTFVCSYCQLEFPLLLELLSHKKSCQKEFNPEANMEIKPDTDEEMKPVVCEMEFDLMETEQHLENEEPTLLDQSSLVETEAATLTDNNSRPKRASRLAAEKKLLKLTKSQDNDASSHEDSSDFDASDHESDSEDSEDEDEILESEDDEVNLADNSTDVTVTQSKPSYSCPQCGKSFLHSNHLIRHEENRKLHDLLRSQAEVLGIDVFQLQRDREVKKTSTRKRFTCKQSGCGRRFSSRKDVIRHKKNTKLHQRLKDRVQEMGTDVPEVTRDLNQTSDQLSCRICRQKFPDVESLASHKLLASGKYKCDPCEKVYCSEKQLDRHLRSYEHCVLTKCRKVTECGDVTYECDTCAEKFDLLRELLSHKQDSHPKEEFLCQPCNKDFVNASSFKDHLLSHTHIQKVGGRQAVWESEKDKTFLCDTCPKKFMTASQLRKHSNYHKNGSRRPKPRYVCEKCGYKFESNSALNLHLKTHIPKPAKRRLLEKPSKCPKCSKRYISELVMYRHLKECGTRFSCDLCDKEYGSLKVLKTHKAQVHLKTWKVVKTSAPMARVNCEICSKTFSKMRFPCHVELKHFRDQSRCPYGCSDKIETSEEWKLHLETCKSEKLTEESKCSCFYCGDLFRNRLLQIQHHLSLHKTFPCKFCDRRFTAQFTLRVHQNEHEESKPHLCTKCGKRYRTEYSLSVHYSSVCADDEAAKEEFIKKRKELFRIFKEKEKPLKCSHCSKGFIEEWRLEAHVKKVHENQGPESEDEEPGENDEEAEMNKTD